MEWVSDLRQKFETLCLEVDGVIQEDAFKYVEQQLQAVGGNIEHQLHTMGANIKQMCSEFVHDVLPAISPDSVKAVALELSPQQSRNIDLACLKELMEGEYSDSLQKHKTCTGMRENFHSSVIENTVVEKPLSTEIPGEDDTAEEDSSMKSIFCGVHTSNDGGLDGQVYMSTPISPEGYDSYVKEGETTNPVNATADTSKEMPSSNSVTLIEASQCRASDVGFTSGDALSAISNDSCWAEFELSHEVAAESDDYVSVAYSVPEGSDYESAETSKGGDVVEPSIETAQFCEMKLDESCLGLDSNKLCSVCLTVAKSQTCKSITLEARAADEQEWAAAPRNEDLDVGLNQWKGECLGLAKKVESRNHDVCDSDWEII